MKYRDIKFRTINPPLEILVEKKRKDVYCKVSGISGESYWYKNGRINNDIGPNSYNKCFIFWTIKGKRFAEGKEIFIVRHKK